jgi:hypothetical protein
MRKYKELGEFGLMDQRGRRQEYIDQERYVQKLKRENNMLKKVLGNLDAGDETHRYVAIESAANEYPISDLCKIFGVSRSGYNAFLKRRKTDRDGEDKALVRKVYEHYKGIGSVNNFV